MRDYEVVYIFNSELEDEDVESRLDSYHEQLTGEGSGEITAVEDWGKRQLAYPIENKENGRYVVAQFSVEPERLEEYERKLKLDGDLLRHLVVLHEEELPTPPSARRPGAGPSEEEEEEGEAEAAEEEGEEPESEEEAEESEEEAEAEEEAGEADESESEEEEAGEEEAAEEEADESGEEPSGDEEEESDEDEGSDEEEEKE